MSKEIPLAVFEKQWRQDRHEKQCLLTVSQEINFQNIIHRICAPSLQHHTEPALCKRLFLTKYDNCY